MTTLHPPHTIASLVSLVASLIFTALPTGQLKAYESPPDIEFKGQLLQSREVLVERKSFGLYTVEIYGTEIAYFRITKAGETIHEMDGTFFRVGRRPHWNWLRPDLQGISPRDRPEAEGDIAMGTDMTGDGIPNLMVYEWLGSASGGHTFHVFEIGDEFRYIQAIGREAHDAAGDFRDLTGDGALEFLTLDDNYGGYGSSRADIPLPRVVLSYRDGDYLIDIELMRRPPPTSDEIQVMIDAVGDHVWCRNMDRYLTLKREMEDIPEPSEREQRVLKVAKEMTDEFSLLMPVTLYHDGLAMIYSGNLESARILFERAAPADLAEEVAAGVQRLLSDVARSTYYEALLELNGVDAF